jgi:hypothetical protein
MLAAMGDAPAYLTHRTETAVACLAQAVLLTLR